MDELIKSSGEPLTFEDFKNENGITYWWASDLINSSINYYFFVICLRQSYNNLFIFCYNLQHFLSNQPLCFFIYIINQSFYLHEK